MAAYTADNFSQIPFNGAYGNKSSAYGVYTTTTAANLVAADTVDLVKIPAGARVLSGRIITATAITTATIAVGIKYSDGTSTGGSTGTAQLSGTGVPLVTANAPQQLAFQSFMNDADTIVYATFVNGAAPGHAIAITAEIDYIATGTK